MRLIQGSPGVGKTSLLDALNQRCQDRCSDERMRNHPYVIPVMITEGNALSHAVIADRIRTTISAMTGSAAGRGLRPLAARLLDLAAHINNLQVLGSGLGWESYDERSPTTIPQPPPNCAILLLIDEIQNAGGGRNDSAGQVMTYLEGGSHGLPILPVLAGLANSSRVMRRLGVSRLGGRAAQRLAPLIRHDVQTAVRSFIETFGLRATPELGTRWGHVLWHGSQGWPKHLQNQLSVLAEHLLRTNGDLQPIRFQDVQREAIHRRRAYYRTRFGDHDPEMIGTIMSHFGRRPVSEKEVRVAIAQTMAQDKWNDHEAPDVNAMLYLGLIDNVPVREQIKLECPIPSLRSFAVAHTGTELHIDVGGGSAKDVRFLLKTHDVNARDDWNRTPLHLAAQDDWSDIIRLLLARGSQTDAHDEWRRTPLHVAAAENAQHSMQVLLDEGADIQTLDSGGHTPLHYAARAGSVQATRILLDHGACPKTRNDDGMIPLHEAAASGSPEGVRLLVQAGSSVRATDDGGWTPLHHAAMADSDMTMQVLLDYGANIQARDEEEKTPLDHARPGSRCRPFLERLTRRSGPKP